MQTLQEKSFNLSQKMNAWKIVLFSNAPFFFEKFENSLSVLQGNDTVDLLTITQSDTFINTIEQLDYPAIIHINGADLDEPELIFLIKKIRSTQQKKLHYIVIWTNNPWEDLPFGFLEKNRVNDLRSLSNLVVNRISYIIHTNIQNLKTLLQFAYLKDNLEAEVSLRTKKIQETNQKLNEALIANNKNSNKLHQQRLQIEKQNSEIKQRNKELERAFKKSTIQHVKLEKALRDNENHRLKLERALKDIQDKNARLVAQNEEIVAQRDHIELQHEELQSQRDLAISQRDKIREQQNEIVDNIKYASRIQRALFPPLDLVQQLLPSYFIFNQPKDVVSGDFYWVSQNRHKTVIAVGDCTGHGISGAMMSMLGTAYLNEIINKHDVTTAPLILEQLRDRVITSLHQEITDNIDYSRDGMDISVCIIDILDNTLEFAGANNPVYLIRDSVITEFTPDKMPIGIHEFYEEPFTSKSATIQSGDSILMFTDGYVDQFGGKHDKKLKYNRFKKYLLAATQLPITQRQAFLKQKFTAWQGDNEQIDDVLILGFDIA